MFLNIYDNVRRRIIEREECFSIKQSAWKTYSNFALQIIFASAIVVVFSCALYYVLKIITVIADFFNVSLGYFSVAVFAVLMFPLYYGYIRYIDLLTHNKQRMSELFAFYGDIKVFAHAVKNTAAFTLYGFYKFLPSLLFIVLSYQGDKLLDFIDNKDTIFVICLVFEVIALVLVYFFCCGLAFAFVNSALDNGSRVTGKINLRVRPARMALTLWIPIILCVLSKGIALIVFGGYFVLNILYCGKIKKED